MHGEANRDFGSLTTPRPPQGHFGDGFGAPLVFSTAPEQLNVLKESLENKRNP